jgi:hypothetical protein
MEWEDFGSIVALLRCCTCRDVRNSGPVRSDVDVDVDYQLEFT